MLLLARVRASPRGTFLRNAAQACTNYSLHTAHDAPSQSRAASEQSRPPKFNEVHRVRNLLSLHRKNADSMGPKDVSAFWSALGKIAHNDRNQKRWIAENQSTLAPVMEHTVRWIGKLEPRDLVTTTYGAFNAGLNGRPPWNELWEHASERAIETLEHFDLWQLSTLLLSFMRVRPHPPNLFPAAILEMQKRDVSELAPAQLCEFARRIASSQGDVQPIMSQVAEAAMPMLPMLRPELLVKLCVAMAGVRARSRPFYVALVEHLPSRVPHFKDRELVTVFCSCMRMYWLRKYELEHLHEVFASCLAERFDNLDDTDLTWVLHGLSLAPDKMQHPPAVLTLFPRLVDRTIHRMEGFTPQELVRITRAVAALSATYEMPEELFEAMASEAVPMVPNLNNFELWSIAWAFGKIGFLSADLFAPLIAHLTPRLRELEPNGLAAVIWSYCQLSIDEHNFMTNLYETFEERKGEYSTKDVERIRGYFSRMDGFEYVKRNAKSFDNYPIEYLADEE